MSHVQSAPPLNPAPGSSWSDPKRYLWLLGPAVPVIGLVMLALYWQTRSPWALWFVVVLVHGIIPALDWLFGEDAANPPESALAGLVQDRYYSWVLYAFVPLQIVATVGGAWLAATGGLPWHHLLGLAISVGMLNGIAINTAHELGHKKDKLDRWLARISLSPTFYGHFFVEHNRGHHKNVSTPVDPASSRMGESFWAFWPRTVVGSLRSAWHLEAERLARSGKSVWSLSNENLQSWGISVVLWGGLLAVFGWIVLPFLLIQAVYGFSLLEVVNYLEHYGLLRRQLPDGRVERCLPEHSWNSNHMVTNLFLYHLQRHSDHHANPTRHYQALRHFEESPQLPAGYAAMILLAYIPPLWFAVMDKRVIRHYQGDLSRINWYGPRREALMARYASRSCELSS
ncbi:MAG: alkane 1-monooxygenase [Aquabacterium sp.]|jgi:alkane 1-monooxygenase|uniref:alkane 1-monooxygenase n=1 Tax=Aquabacterium sp. TaxID=1872578 RepID=UPI001B48F319|nr:alkane 1-monooxygenase [Aquabacterium sp.]MBP7133540.1 alkane 1-monooxygenase [Aquabacterium sp.]MBP9063663.1 alkane 1-monooxygenase [Aquabacterium sp.]MDQ5926721.1 alkane 1-monooxygenase [Pseudomonadota bacterium]